MILLVPEGISWDFSIDRVIKSDVNLDEENKGAKIVDDVIGNYKTNDRAIADKHYMNNIIEHAQPHFIGDAV